MPSRSDLWRLPRLIVGHMYHANHRVFCVLPEADGKQVASSKPLLAGVALPAAKNFTSILTTYTSRNKKKYSRTTFIFERKWGFLHIRACAV
jgi:hypothetical protein